MAENLERRSFERGWVPTVDLMNGPPDGLLRMDNLILDDQGNISLRKGSKALYDTPLSGGPVHSLYSTYVGPGIHRYAVAGGNVYYDGLKITTIGGSGDVHFASDLGFNYFARGRQAKKHDGSALYNWGIAAPGSKPAVAAVDGDIISIASGAEAGWQNVNAQTAADHGNDHGDGPAGAVQFADDGSGAIGASLNFISPLDLSGTPEDTLEFFVKATLVKTTISRFLLLFDCSDGTFQQDYFWYDFSDVLNAKNTTSVQLPHDDQSFLEPNYDVEGEERRRVFRNREDKGALKTTVVAYEFTRLSAGRAQFFRSGYTPDKGWNTIQGVKVYVEYTTGGSQSITVDVDTIRVRSGFLTGKYTARYVYVRQFPQYLAKSGPSAISDEVNVETGSLQVTVAGSTDSQVNDIWVYVMGGTLDRFYLATKVGSNSGGVVDVKISEREILVDGEELETAITIPPQNISGVLERPHHERIFVITPKFVWPSKRLDPDAFDTGQVIAVGDGETELNWWIVRIQNDIYVGTSKDIHRIEGDGAEFPDGTINFTLRGLGIGNPPVNSFFCQEGNIIVYMADDGPRVFNGVDSQPIRAETDLLWKGQDRYGVGHIDFSGRFRGVLTKGVLKFTAPETPGTGNLRDSRMRIDEFSPEPRGEISRALFALFGFDPYVTEIVIDSTTPSQVLWCRDGIKQRWYRHTYPQAFMSLYREPDGSIIAGDSLGNVWQLDVGAVDQATKVGTGGSPISYNILTKMDDNGKGLNRKDPFDFQIFADGSTSVQFFADDPASTPIQIGSVGSVSTPFITPISSVPAFIRVQVQIQGQSSSGFRFWGYNLAYRPRPQFAVLRDTGYVDLPGAGGSREETTWIREAWLKVWTNAAVLTVTPYFDGVKFADFIATIPVPGQVNRVRVPFPRNYKGKQPRIVVQAFVPNTRMRIDEFPASPHGGDLDQADIQRYPLFGFAPTQIGINTFELYWIEFRFEQVGSQTEKPYARVMMP